MSSMDTRLDSLSSACRTKVICVLARLVERGIAVKIVQTSRTLEEHAQNIANGTSKTAHSKHLPRWLRGLDFPHNDPDLMQADAIDLCPFEVYELHGPDKLQWDAVDPAFRAIGEEGEREDLRWGGRWYVPRDPGHLELILSDDDRVRATEERARRS